MDFPQASQRQPDPADYVADRESCGTAAMSELQKPLPDHQFSGGKGRANAQQFYREVQLQVKPGRLAPGQREVYLYLGLDLDRLSVQQIRLILPLLHGLDRCRGQHRVPAD